ENGLRLSLPVRNGITSVGSTWRSDCTVDSRQMRGDAAVFTRDEGGVKVRNVGTDGSVSVESEVLPHGAVSAVHPGQVVRVADVNMELQSSLSA
ncbi:MAG: hypothetical protein IJT94_08150, partial [Oscillibacter sp.]|nr:hypothetical protein [Oscillibacter sp.]